MRSEATSHALFLAGSIYLCPSLQVWSMSALRGTVLGGVDEALPYDAVFRIEVSLSSQTTSVIVMRTTARLYCLQGAHSNRPSAGDAEWRSLAYGAPCIQLVRHGNREDNHPFTIKIVIAEVESGRWS
jgi:hypothetical protein